MAARIGGIYSTAIWDYENDKSHFLYDKYSCMTQRLPDDKMAPLHFKNPTTGIDYYFSPVIEMLENTTRTTNVQIVTSPEPILVRGRPTWQWSAILDEWPIDVYYSIATADMPSVPLRMVLKSKTQETKVDLEYHEIFKFRIGNPDPEVFRIPELADCQTSHSPRIPQFRKSEFRSKMEIKDRIVGDDGYESPVYDIDITYDYQQRLSRYEFATTGFDELKSYFGDTILDCVDDFNSDLTYCTDRLGGNCSVYAIGDNEYPASDVWFHGGIVSMKDPEWFWHISDRVNN